MLVPVEERTWPLVPFAAVLSYRAWFNLISPAKVEVAVVEFALKKVAPNSPVERIQIFAASDGPI